MFGYGILFLVDVVFIVHAAKTGRFTPWAYVILFLPGIGTLAYLFVEVLPEYRHAPQVRKARFGFETAVAPTRRYRALRGELEIADTLGNRLALAQECQRMGRNDEALVLYEDIIKSPQGDEPLYFLGKAQAETGLKLSQDALDTLDELKKRWPDYRSQEGHLLYARALENLGRSEEALSEYGQLAGYFAGQEVQARRLLLLDKMGRVTDAEAIADEMMRYYKRAPRHARHQQAEWFAAARDYLRKRPRAV